jgi:flagellar biosynthesis chaperone FliJ
MSVRAVRASRLAELRERAVREAQGALAEATRAVASARETLRLVEVTWAAHADAEMRCASAADLAASSAYLATLRIRVEQARARVTSEVAAEERMRAKVQGARMEQRKIELWRDGIVSGERVEEDRRERIAGDEVAARMRRA